MKAEIKPKIEDRKRVPLQDVLPLKVPFSIQIDIADACNMKCNFCFHSDIASIKKNNVRFGLMKIDVFKKIIDDIKTEWKGEKIKKIRLFAHGEPLLNKNICEMTRYVKDAGVAEIIELTTNGTLFNKEFNESIADSGMGIINISVNGISSEQYKKQCDYDMNWDSFVDGIRDLYNHRGGCRIFIKLSDIGYSTEEKSQFYNTFGDICDQIFIENISSSLWQDTDVHTKIIKNEKGLYGQDIVRKKVCTSIFTTMVINSQGKAKLCCTDWKNEIIIGDTLKESIKEIWESEVLKKIRIRFLEGGRDSMMICKECESPEITTPDNIDNYMKDILGRFK